MASIPEVPKIISMYVAPAMPLLILEVNSEIIYHIRLLRGKAYFHFLIMFNLRLLAVLPSMGSHRGVR